ncbi:MAG: hypothetical protein MZV63_27280 [Marinilabiliales bacterium]|nr:hypothetical protein [Marinilabiliales bacterium]
MADNLSYSQLRQPTSALQPIDYIVQVGVTRPVSTKIAAYERPAWNQRDPKEMPSRSSLPVSWSPRTTAAGPEFGLYMAPGRTAAPLIRLPEYAPMASLQVIHNPADTAAEVVDVLAEPGPDPRQLQALLRSASPFI